MKSVTSAFSFNNRVSMRAEAIARAWAEKERRRHAVGAYTESSASVLQTSMAVVPGFSVRAYCSWPVSQPLAGQIER